MRITVVDIMKIQNEDNLERVKEKIWDAFKDAKYPGDDKIVYDNDDLDCMKMKSFLKGKDWRDVSSEILMKDTSSIFYLSNDGLYYFIPSYIMASLNENIKIDVIYDYTIRSLTPPSGMENWDDFSNLSSKLTIKQKEAIHSFLNFEKLRMDECATRQNRNLDGDPLYSDLLSAIKYWGFN